MNGSMGGKVIFLQKLLDPTPKRNLVWKRWISPQREIWSGSNGSHLKEKSDQGAMDPPEGNLGWKTDWRKKRELTSTKRLTLA